MVNKFASVCFECFCTLYEHWWFSLTHKNVLTGTLVDRSLEVWNSPANYILELCQARSRCEAVTDVNFHVFFGVRVVNHSICCGITIVLLHLTQKIAFKYIITDKEQAILIMNGTLNDT